MTKYNPKNEKVAALYARGELADVTSTTVKVLDYLTQYNGTSYTMRELKTAMGTDLKVISRGINALLPKDLVAEVEPLRECWKGVAPRRFVSNTAHIDYLLSDS